MKFPKLNLAGLVKAPKGLLPEDREPSPTKPLKTPMSKFEGMKRSLAEGRNITKKYKI